MKCRPCERNISSCQTTGAGNAKKKKNRSHLFFFYKKKGEGDIQFFTSFFFFLTHNLAGWRVISHLRRQQADISCLIKTFFPLQTTEVAVRVAWEQGLSPWR